MPISESVVYFFPLGDCPWGVVDQPRDGRGPSKAIVTWSDIQNRVGTPHNV